jgi:hypothetical protein
MLKLLRPIVLASIAASLVLSAPAHARASDDGMKDKQEKLDRKERKEHDKRGDANGGTPAAQSPTAVHWLLTMHGRDGKPQGVWGLTDQGELMGPLNAPIADGPAGLVPHDLRGLTPLPDGGFLAMNAYIKDTRILRFGAKDASGAYPYLGDFAKAGAAVPAFAHGYQIAIGPDGKVYVSNQDSNTVTCFAGVTQPNAGEPVSLANAANNTNNAGGAPGVIVPSDKTSPEGIKDVRGIAFGPVGLLYVCVRGAGCVSAYDTTTGRRVKVIAEGRHGLKRPIQALFSSDGATMFVGDNGANCVFKVDVASGRVEVFVKKDDAGLTEPSALAIDGAWLYVGNRERKQILRFSLADGKADDKPFATLPDNPEFLMRVGG